MPRSSDGHTGEINRVEPRRTTTTPWVGAERMVEDRGFEPMVGRPTSACPGLRNWPLCTIRLDYSSQKSVRVD